MKTVKDCRIVFMGTPAFAVAILEKLVKENCQVVAVVTAPDKPAGRGMQMSQSAVKQFALLHNLPVLQPVKLKDPEFLAELKSFDADIQVVVAFRMLPEAVWNMPSLGTINLHASLLPKYRGAAPINWAIINGEKVTGITTFKLQHTIDTGDILMRKQIQIREDETAGELHDEMMVAGADLVFETLSCYCSGNLLPIPQEEIMNQLEGNVPEAPKLHTETCKINWEKKSEEVYNLIRGLSPYPTAFTYLNGKMLKIFKATYEMVANGTSAGQVESDGKSYLRFASTDGWVYIKELQLEGKKRMLVEDFLRGYRLS
ncbi:MAG: methionyl-tRNA formyltransferase [Chitinophagaceae bacterium]